MTFKEFQITTDFENKAISYFEYSISNPLIFTRFEDKYPEVKAIFKQNEDDIIDSFFESLYHDIEVNDDIKLNEYLSFISLEFTADKHYKYFRTLLEKLLIKVERNKILSEYLSFIWAILDYILHFGIDINNPEDFNSLFMSLYNLSKEIDPTDKYLLQQKINQLINQ